MSYNVPTPSVASYRPASFREATALKSALRDAIVAAKGTVPPGRGRLTRSNDIARGRAFDLVGLQACVAELVAAGADRDALRGIARAVDLWILEQFPAPGRLTIGEMLDGEAEAQAMADRAAFAVATNQQCPTAWSRFIEMMHHHKEWIDRGLSYAMHRRREVAR